MWCVPVEPHENKQPSDHCHARPSSSLPMRALEPRTAAAALCLATYPGQQRHGVSHTIGSRIVAEFGCETWKEIFCCV